jgi:phage baseplate assembly protein V
VEREEMNVSDIQRIVRDMVKPLKNAALLMIGRGILLAADDTQKIQLIQASLLADEVKDQMEMFAHYGFTSCPPEGTEIVAASVGGSRDNAIAVASEHRQYRLKNLEKGESALYNGMSGKYIWLKKNGNTEVTLNKLKINNANYEAVAVLSEFMDEVINGLTITAIGPQPWEPDTKARLQAVKDKLDTFKV